MPGMVTMTRLRLALAGSIVWIPACTPSLEDPSVRSQMQASTASPLTGAEWSAYSASRDYLHHLVSPGMRVRLNYADPQQRELAMLRLKLAGKTADTAPYLFELLEARRRDHVARGLTPGTVAETIHSAHTAARTEMHYIEASSPGDVRAGTAAPVAVGTASSTAPGGAAYTYVDISVSTTADFPIAPVQFREEFDNPDGLPGANVTISTSGDPRVANVKRYLFESFKFEERDDGELTDSYLRVEAGAANPLRPAGNPQLSAPLLEAPADPIADGLINLCMERQWLHDCDLVLPGANQAIRVPLKGSIGIASSHVFDTVRIDQLRMALNNGDNPPDQGSLKLILLNAGGGCDVTDSNTLVARMAPFWNRVAVSADGRVLSWDLTGDHAAFFDEGCAQAQNRAKLTARIPLPLLAVPSREVYTSSITISNDPDVLRPEGVVLPIALTNSCLAAGTEIELGDGTLAAIESLGVGAHVLRPGTRDDLTITDLAAGVETAAMVRIRDRDGRTLLMTEMHPIATPDRGIVQARELRTGDQVTTRHGPSALIEVSREPYSGKVHNLKLGSTTEMAGLGPDQTLMFANGFVVGDGQIQRKYEALAWRRSSAQTQVPERWRRDYLSSLHHN